MLPDELRRRPDLDDDDSLSGDTREDDDGRSPLEDLNSSPFLEDCLDNFAPPPPFKDDCLTSFPLPLLEAAEDDDDE